jgi:nucleoside-diphosphate-sugar epimerase
MRFIVTGATGAIGMSLLSLLVNEGHEVTVLVNPDSARKQRLQLFPRLTLIDCGAQDYEKLELSGPFDIFIHMAWNGGKDRNSVATNFDSTIQSVNSVDLANRLGCSTFLATGSQAECGPQNVALDEFTFCTPDSAFGVAKLASMHLTRGRCNDFGIRFLWLRVCSVYGPYDGEQTMIVSAIRELLKGNLPQLSSGQQLWDFVHSDDIAKAIVLLSLEKLTSGLYVVGEGGKLKLREYIEHLAIHFGHTFEELIRPGAGVPIPLNSLLVNPQRLNREVGWYPNIRFETGLLNVIEYCRNNQ